MDSIAYPDRKHALQIAKQPLGVSRTKPLVGSFNRGGGCEKPTNEFEWQGRCYCSKKILSIRFTTALRFRHQRKIRPEKLSWILVTIQAENQPGQSVSPPALEC